MPRDPFFSPNSWKPVTQATTTHLVFPAGLPWRDLLPRAQTQVAWRRFSLPLALLLAVGLSLSTLSLGFFLDDYVMLHVIEGRNAFDAPPVNLYASFMESSNVWWRSSEARFAFWRPLTSELLRIDYFLFGRQPLFYHVQLLLGLAALIFVCHQLYQRDLSPAIAGGALLLLAVDEAHAYTSGVICNGHSLISVLPAFLGLLAYLRWRESGWRPGAALAVLGYGIGLLGGETAFAALAYPVAYELFAASGPRRRRVRAIAPLGILALSYLIYYKAAGFGPGEAGVYLNPLNQPPAQFLTGLALYLPVYLASLLLAVPMDLPQKTQAFLVPVLIAGVTVPPLLFHFWQKIRGQLSRPNRKALNWWVPGAMVALVPVAFAPPSERQLLVPMVGLAPLFSSLAVVAWHTWRYPLSTRRTRVLALIGLLLIVSLHAGMATWNRVSTQQGMFRLNEKLEATASQAQRFANLEAADDQEFVLLNADFLSSYYLPYLLSPRPGHSTWSVVSNAPYELQLTRTSARTLVLETINGQLLATPPERLFLSPGQAPAVGSIVKNEQFSVEILQANEIGPTKLAFHFTRNLNDPALSLLTVEEGHLARLPILATGESLRLPAPVPLTLP